MDSQTSADAGVGLAGNKLAAGLGTTDALYHKIGKGHTARNQAMLHLLLVRTSALN